MIKPADPPDTPEQPNTSADDPSPEVRELLNKPNILECVEEQMRSMGLAGDTRPSMLAYVAITSRHLERPINLSLVGASSSGKSRKLQYAMDLHPEEAYEYQSASSPLALIYEKGEGDDDGTYAFTHRTIIMAEADSLAESGPAGSAIRSLVEDHEMVYKTLIDQKPVTINKKGPTGLITTGVQPLKPQLRTRVLEVHLDPDQDAVNEVLYEIARNFSGEGSEHDLLDTEAFKDMQTWIAEYGCHEVAVPFAARLVPFLPRGAAVLRSYTLLGSAIQACALLHQRQRERDDQGRIIATLADYEMVRPLLDDCFKLLATGGLTPAVRRVVENVPVGKEISLTDLAKKLERAKSTVSEQVQQAIDGGWLSNWEWNQGLPYRLRRKDPLPDGNVSGLPSVDQLRLAMNDEQLDLDFELDPMFSQAALEAIQELFTPNQINA